MSTTYIVRMAFVITLKKSMDWEKYETLAHSTFADVKNKLNKKWEPVFWEDDIMDHLIEEQSELLDSDSFEFLGKKTMLTMWLSPKEHNRRNNDLDSYLIQPEQWGTIKYIPTNIYPYSEGKIAVHNNQPLSKDILVVWLAGYGWVIGK